MHVNAVRKTSVCMVCAALTALLLSSCYGLEPVISGRAAGEPAPIEPGIAPGPGPYAPGFDAVHYDISLTLPDTGTSISGRTIATVRVDEARRDSLALDFTGLAVREVIVDGTAANFRHQNGKLYVPVPAAATSGRTFDVSVAYSGRPDDGLILGRNLHGRPTAFADNWPNRARFWFPSIDHPSDKATVTFSVRLDAEAQRRVIANGELLEAADPGVWVWTNREPIPTYTMVVGVAEFAVDLVGEVCEDDRCVEVTTWLFPPDANRASVSFRRADQMVRYYSDLIAPFPYAKMAHVQAATRFGGMENVTAVFYPQDVLSEGRDIETTVAHETAHQWFGDAVTEADWHHLWLSEGFAEYFEALFFEHADGLERFKEIMEAKRTSYLASGAAVQPIVNPDLDNLFELLNANNYQKGAWVLHMLRTTLGDQDFFKGIRSYYRTFEHETVLTEDFRLKLEEASGMDLGAFFDRWVFQPGHPQLEIEWMWTDGEATVRVEQVQEWPVFTFPLELQFATPEGSARRRVDVGARAESFRLPVAAEPQALEMDPDGRLLKEIINVNRTIPDAR